MKTIKEKINQDFQKALKEGEKDLYNLLRMVKSATKNAEIEKRAELSNEEMISLLNKEIKKRKEAIELYKKGGRQELAQKEEAEMEILTRYLPPQMSEEEIKKLVLSAINNLKVKSKSEFGKVMGFLMPQIKGRADGRKVSEIVRKELDKL